MEYTEEEWIIDERFPQNEPALIIIKADNEIIFSFEDSSLSYKKARKKAEFIVAAVNACKKINPDNPIAVAEILPDLLDACKAQHEAIDRLFARLIEKEENFFPSKSGQPWTAIIKGNQVIARVERKKK